MSNEQFDADQAALNFVRATFNGQLAHLFEALFERVAELEATTAVLRERLLIVDARTMALADVTLGSTPTGAV